MHGGEDEVAEEIKKKWKLSNPLTTAWNTISCMDIAGLWSNLAPWLASIEEPTPSHLPDEALAAQT